MAKIKYNPNQLAIDFDAIIEEYVQEVFLHGDIHNIAKMLPMLFPSQHEDVARAEKRFTQGKGYLFTNGTGTGKTFVGLGIAYRFWYQGAKNIIIVCPTDAKCGDWIDEAKHVGLEIYKLVGIEDAGNGHDIVVTTYANFYANMAINERSWDLVEYDEAHYLNQNMQGKETVYQQKHRRIVKVPSVAKILAYEQVGPKPKDAPWEALQEYKNKYWQTVHDITKSTKVVFLSATPFAYHKSIDYADGCLFDIHESLEPDDEKYSFGYNEADKFQSFMQSNFGYQMRYNKLQIPDRGVDQDLMERQFFEKYAELGVMSTRQLDLPFDYSRQFITLDSEIGEFIDEGMNVFHSEGFDKQYKILYEKFSTKYNHTYFNQLLESIKAKDIHIRIQQHLDLKRKVVVFHGFNNSVIEHPFQFNANALLTAEESSLRWELEKEIVQFKANYRKYWDMDLSSLTNARQAITKHFPWARQFNGTINKKVRANYIKEFQNDRSGMNLILVQQAAGREGISLHDKTGVHQRALINLGLPTAPTAAIQIEGRVYREGLKSNAIYEYITLQTSNEKIAFGQTIATRAKTAENLAMGNLARDLETSFKEGYNNSSYEVPNLGQGVGGKEFDKSLASISEFDAARSYYFSRGKRTSANKSKEGKDYFATPEPLGYKIVQWLNPLPEEDGLEPSAGHGAIARYFPKYCVNTFVEPSHELRGQLAINCTGTVRDSQFEQLSVVNKADFIAMNPPFGTAGKLAMEHLQKAIVKHLRVRGRLIAIVPAGASMDKRIEQFISSEDGERVNFTGEILLPACTFERAGTTTYCKVLRFDHIHAPNRQFIRHDLTYIDNITDFFEVLEDLNF